MEHIDKLSYNMPVWTRIDDVPMQFPWLDEDAQAEICVVGGGLTGSLCAMELARSGHDVLLITDGMAGAGETARSMPCACADLGTNIRQLRRSVGEVMTRYLLKSARAELDRLERLAGEISDAENGGEDGGIYDIGFERRDCFIYTDDDAEAELMNREFTDRCAMGCDCSFVGRSAARDMFPFEVFAGILLPGQACVFDPYRLAHHALRSAMQCGARVYENTKALRVDSMESIYGGEESGRGWIIVTGTHRLIECDRVVIAAGEACREVVEGVITPRTSYMSVSHRLRGGSGWPGKCVLRTFSSPELTVAMSPDRRIFARGLSSSVMDENARFAGLFPMPSVHERRFSELEAGARYLCPPLSVSQRNGFEFAQAYRGCRTSDGLPIVGECEGREGCVFALPGGGGALMSMLCAHTARDIADGGSCPSMLSPQRRSLRDRIA